MPVELIPIAQQIWDAKYRLKAPDGTPIDQTVEATWMRVAQALAYPEGNQSQTWATRFYDAMEGFKFIPAGRHLAGAGTERSVTLFNCFVMGTIPDSLDGIFSHLREAALTMQQGGGIGYDFSTLRPKGARVRGVDADASGPLSFMDVWDAMCKTLMSAGARRGAMMACMRCDHPDVLDFINAKHQVGRLTQFNMSVLVTDPFMEAVKEDRDWLLGFPVDSQQPEIYRCVKARELWEAIMRSTYDHAEPGVIFIDRVNSQNNLHYCETISATNPCGEQPLPPYGCCDLGSINLAALVKHPFTQQAHIDTNDLEWIVPLAVRMLDNAYDVSRFPLPMQMIEGTSKRRVGLGVTGLANALAMCCVRYGTMDAAQLTQSWMQSIEDRAYQASCDLAIEKGPFPLFDRDGWMASHTFQRLPTRIRGEIAKHGMRNSHLMSVAPTGTISLFAGNVSGGIEPVFAFKFKRKILQKDGTRTEEVVEDYAYALYRKLLQAETPQQQIDWDKKELPLCFVTAQDLTPDEHLIMQAAAQSRCDASISKTVNTPKDIDFESFKDVYRKAYELGCKSCTTHRPNDVVGSVLTVDENVSAEVKVTMNPFEGLTGDAYVRAVEEAAMADDRRTGNRPACRDDGSGVMSSVIDRAVRNSPPPLDDVGGVDVVTFDEEDPNRPHPLTPEDVESLIRFSDANDRVLKGLAEEEDDEPDDLLPSRPESLTGRTYKIRWPNGVTDHAYYVTVNDDEDGRPFEVFINSKDVDHQAWTAALTRMVSAIFRRGGDVSFVAEELKSVHDPKGGAWIDRRFVPSLLAAIGGVIERHLDTPGRKVTPEAILAAWNKMNETDPTVAVMSEEAASIILKHQEDREADVDHRAAYVSDRCPRCGDHSLTHSGGCATCQSCGWSRCD